MVSFVLLYADSRDTIAENTVACCFGVVQIIYDRHRHDVELNKRAVELFRTMLFTEVCVCLVCE